MPKLAGTLQDAADSQLPMIPTVVTPSTFLPEELHYVSLTTRLQTTLATQGLRYSVTTLDGPM
jgi:hypothetical protein